MIGLCGAAGLGALLEGCRRREQPGHSTVPPGTVRAPGVYRDVSPRWSNDGRQVAFLRATTDRRYQLFTASPDLTDAQPHLEPDLANPDRPLRTGRGGFAAPEGLAWSADDRRIAFPRVEWFSFDEGDRLPGTALFAFDTRARKVEPLALHPRKYTDELYYYRSPQWSPDGKRLALAGEAPDGSTALLVRDLRRLGAIVEDTVPDTYHEMDWPTWSPDGTRLVFRQGILRSSTADAAETLRMISPGGMEAGRLFALTPTDYRHLGFDDPRNDPDSPAPRFASPAWSPDGTRIAFTITPDAVDRTCYGVYVLTVGSGQLPKRVSPRDGRGYLAPVWIDTERIGAVRPASKGWEVVALSVNGPGAPEVLAQLASDDFDWSPDRKRILCAPGPTGGGLQIIAMSL